MLSSMALRGLVKDYLVENILTTKPEYDVLTVLKTVVTGIDQLPVIDNKGQLVGMITWQDISEKVILKGKNPKRVKVRSIMKTELTTLSPRDSIKKALNLVTKGKFALPVVESKRLVGLLSFMDVLKSYLETVDTSLD